MKHTILTGIDIQTNKISVLVARLDADGSLSPIVHQSEPIYDCMKRGIITDTRAVAAVIKKMLAKIKKGHDLTVERVIVSFNGESLTAKKNTVKRKIHHDESLTSLDEELFKENAEHAHQKQHPNDKILCVESPEYTVDGMVGLSSISGLTAKKTVSGEFLIASGFVRHLRTLERAIEQNGLEIESIHPSPLVTGFFLFEERQKRAGCLSIDIDTETTSWGAFHKGKLYSIGCVPLGLYDMSISIAEKMGIGIQEAIPIASKKSRRGSNIETIKKDVLQDVFHSIAEKLKKECNEAIPLSGGVVIIAPAGLRADCERIGAAFFSAPITCISKNDKMASDDPRGDDGALLVAKALISYHSENLKRSGIFNDSPLQAIIRQVNKYLISPIKRQFR